MAWAPQLTEEDPPIASEDYLLSGATCRGQHGWICYLHLGLSKQRQETIQVVKVDCEKWQLCMQTESLVFIVKIKLFIATCELLSSNIKRWRWTCAGVLSSHYFIVKMTIVLTSVVISKQIKVADKFTTSLSSSFILTKLNKFLVENQTIPLIFMRSVISQGCVS